MKMVNNLAASQGISNLSYQLQLCVHMLHDQGYSHLVLATAWHYNVCMSHGGCYIVSIGGFHHVQILLEHALKVASTL